MFFYVALAIANGILIGISRALNGRLSSGLGPFKASWSNHLVGFLFISILLVSTTGFKNPITSEPPFAVYSAGVLGALFVAVTSSVFQRLGAMKSALFIICGQMLGGIALDSIHHKNASFVAQFSGLSLILLGLYLGKRQGVQKGEIG